jgi:hypothetical protein
MPQRKTVSFYPMIRMRRVERHDEESASELWYSLADVRAFTVANYGAVKQYRENAFMESSMETFMGLECLLKKQEMKQKRDCIYNAVLQAQRYYHGQGSANIPEQIATVYKETMAIFSYEQTNDATAQLASMEIFSYEQANDATVQLSSMEILSYKQANDVTAQLASSL